MIVATVSACVPTEAPSCATLDAHHPPAVTVERLIAADDGHHVDLALRCARQTERDDARKYLLTNSACEGFQVLESAVVGDHATVRIHCAADASPLPFGLVRDGGVWRIDVAETRRLSQQVFEKNLRARGASDHDIDTARGFIKDPPPPRDAAPAR